MFKNPFSFEGRIGRFEYGFSVAIFLFLTVLFSLLTESMIGTGQDFRPLVYTIFTIPIYWFYLAQGAKRAHDIGISGWLGSIHFFVIIILLFLERPIYYSYNDNNIYDALIGITFFLNFLLFAIKDGEIGPNKYGENPKGIGNAPQSGFTNNPQYPNGGYQNGNNFGGYNGGYNNQQQGQQPQQGGSFYNGGHNANNQQQWQQQPPQTTPQQPKGNGKEFDGNLYGKAN